MSIKYMNTSALVKDAALKRGFKVSRCEKKGLLISDGRNTVSFRGGRSSINTPGIGLICSDKDITKAYLKRKKISVPFGNVFSVFDAEKIKKFAGVVGWPLVLKPVNGSQGKGVFSGISSEAELDKAIEEVKFFTDTVIVEEHVDGLEHRFLFLGDKVVAVMQRIPANVIGDGESSIETLIKNKNIIKSSRKTKAQSSILIDDHLLNKIGKDGYTLDSVPPEGACVFLRNNSNLSTGGDGVDKTYTINSKIKKDVEKAALAIPGLAWAGLDVIIDKNESKYAVIEINTSPMISMHHFPWQGEPVDIANMFLDYAFSK
ncbi:hypothetical protein CLM76_17665 [Vreelandella venusta]|nr:hypothetical protein CLM76_17665 [Halomonas hydrothermalis]